MFLQNCQIKEGMTGRGRLVINIGVILMVGNGLNVVGGGMLREA